MLSPQSAFECLSENGICSFAGVPDSLLKDFCAYVSDHTDQSNHVITANEGNAIAIAAGKYLGSGALSLVYLQNSGLGNIVNPLLSLVDVEVYKIPVLIMIGWRGEPGVKDEPQHIKQGRVTPSLLDAMEIPWFEIGPDTENPLEILQKALDTIKQIQAPVALLIRKGTFESYKLQSERITDFSLTREQAIQQILPLLPSDALIVSTTGMTSREVFEHRVATGEGHGRDFLTVGCMGHTSSIAYGLALVKTNRPIVCLDGDGSMLMHLGATAIQGASNLPNFLHILINNGAHDSVGGQPTVGLQIDLPKVASTCGYRHVRTTKSSDEISNHINALLASDVGPNLLEIKVKKGARSNLGRPTTTPLANRDAFMSEALK